MQGDIPGFELCVWGLGSAPEAPTAPSAFELRVLSVYVRFEVSGFGFRTQGLELRFKVLRYLGVEVDSFEFRASVFGFRVSGVVFRVSCFGLKVSSSRPGFRVLCA